MVNVRCTFSCVWFSPSCEKWEAQSSKWKYVPPPGIEPATPCFPACRSNHLSLSQTYTATALRPLRDQNSKRSQRSQRSRNKVLQLVADSSATGRRLIGDWLPTDRRLVGDLVGTSLRVDATGRRPVGDRSPTNRRPVADRSPTKST